MEEGRLVWLPVTDSAAWVRAAVVDASSVRRVDTNATVSLAVADLAKLSLASPEDASPPVEDLSQLSDSSDATFLDALRRRYACDDIYTAIGPVIISVNPYKPVGGCTSEAIARLCKEGEASEPHVVRVASIAFQGMSAHGDARAQSILISGESGAGKTESTKLVPS